MKPVRYVEKHLFEYLFYIEPDVNDRGTIKKHQPQSRYKNTNNYPLNKYGKGTFCRFSVPSNYPVSGVYALYVDDELKYIGECVDVSSRFNIGYGLISPRNCYLYGQETNCRINKKIYREASRNKKLACTFIKQRIIS